MINRNHLKSQIKTNRILLKPTVFSIKTIWHQFKRLKSKPTEINWNQLEADEHQYRINLHQLNQLKPSKANWKQLTSVETDSNQFVETDQNQSKRTETNGHKPKSMNTISNPSKPTEITWNHFKTMDTNSNQLTSVAKYYNHLKPTGITWHQLNSIGKKVKINGNQQNTHEAN